MARSIMEDELPNSPEPPPIGAVSPRSRLTVLAARLSFCLGHLHTL